MDPNRWQRIKDLLEEALQLGRDERTHFLDAECETDEERREVESLLASHDTDPGFLESDVAEDTRLAIRQKGIDPADGRTAGRYRLLREIGRGGMGTVFLAERADGVYDQHVAVKLVSEGRVSESVLHRMRQERQILARLQHPGIARLLDGGITTSGHPYLVMEFVEGLPVTDYCRRHKLPVEDRLDLFEEVCSAVQYAHQNLVIHRDLKPSNIMVTTAGRVKLLDFGIAKLLDDVDTSDLTRTGQAMMTPAYASPEQVRGESVSTAADVYSLGVLLYEMLTDRLPYDLSGKTPIEIERLVCDIRPDPPSARIESEPGARRLSGDLDTIVLMALRKEPDRRYESAGEFAADVRRHLEHVPVSARPATIGYRLSSFIRRNRALVAAGLLILLVLVAGIISTAMQARIASEERDRAQVRSGQLHLMAMAMLGDLHETIRDLPGTTPARRSLVEQASRYLDVLAAETPHDSLREDLAESYIQLGEIQGDPHFPNLGDISAAAERYEAALAVRESVWRTDSLDVPATRNLAVTIGRMAVIDSWAGDNDRAIRRSHRALDLLDRIPGNELDTARDRMRIRSELGWWYVWAGRSSEAMEHLNEARALGDRLRSEGASDVDFLIDYWRIFAYMSDARQFDGDVDGALRVLEGRGTSIADSLADAHPLNPRAQDVAQSNRSKIARLYALSERYDEALAAYDDLLGIAQRAARHDTADVRLSVAVGGIHHASGDVLTAQGNDAAALEQYTRALEIRRRAWERDMSNGEIGYVVASSLRELCGLHRSAGRLEQAISACMESASIQGAVVQADPGNLVGRSALRDSFLESARVEAEMADRLPAGSPEKVRHLRNALEAYDQAVDTMDQLLADGAPDSWASNYDEIVSERSGIRDRLKTERGGRP